MLKALTFDLGDTLIDYGPMHYRPMMRYGVRQAYDYLEALRNAPAPDLPPFPLFSRRICRAVRHAWYRSKFLVQDRDTEPIIAAVLQAFGLALAADEQRELLRRFFSALQRMAQPTPSAAETLAALAERRLKLAVISNTVLPPWLLDESLAAAGILDYLPQRFYSCRVGSKKPRRQVFRHALEQLGAAPQETLHVGDRYLTDVWGAKRAGLWACLKTGHRSHPLPPVRPHFRIRHLPELLPLVDRMMQRP